eukprot:TRINITY_DN8983_c0_g2_i1.p1 TRINITY_DN8983_c0_g2~~TRINITY_DN8983_c0_g2_i1.p1  ORF type:complete len:368 (+),score=52.93 TRINITY_DN8983_c0_g2_i1:110-1105(+)
MSARTTTGRKNVRVDARQHQFDAHPTDALLKSGGEKLPSRTVADLPRAAQPPLEKEDIQATSENSDPTEEPISDTSAIEEDPLSDDTPVSPTERKLRNVVSFVLYGNDPRYINGAYENAKSVHTEFPGWEAQFYVDDTVQQSVRDKLLEYGATLRDVPANWRRMFRRFLVADDETVGRFIVRDADSRLQQRDWEAVQDWIRSGKRFHCLRDHPSHSNYPLSGGLWGATTGWLPNMKDMITEWQGHDDYIADMDFLNAKIYPMVKDNDLYCNDAYSCKRYPNSHPFPTLRNPNGEHCGQVFFGDGKARQGDIDILLRAGMHSPDCPPSRAQI